MNGSVANFYRSQFRFLTDVYKLLNTGDFADTSLKDYLQSSILRTCKGHLDWCFNIAKLTHTLTWTSQCRPFGSQISPEVDIVQGAMHFLKLFEATENLFLGDDYVSDTLAKRLESWMDHLHAFRTSKAGLWAGSTQIEKLQKHEDSYVFDYKISIPCYYLCDAVLIWQATSAVHAMMTAALSNSDRESDAIHRLKSIKMHHFRNTTSLEEMRSLILERFSYDHTFPILESIHTYNEDDSNRKAGRLLAFSRNGTQKPRFYWDSESMYLCEGYDGGFFSELPASQALNTSGIYNGQERRLEQWWSSLKLQQRFQQAFLWKKPNRYILALILASNSDFSIDGSIDKKGIIDLCYKVLLQSVLAGGTMATSIHPLSQSPLYTPLGSTTSTFDVPHYLLRQQYRDILIRPISEHLELNGLNLENLDNTKKRMSKNYKHEKSKRSLRKSGFYAIVDKGQVFTNPCEPDWLFNDPDFFTNEERPCDQDALQKMVAEWQETYENMDLSDMKDFIGRLTDFWKTDMSSSQREPRQSRSLTLVEDVVKADGKGSRKMVRESYYWPRGLLELLCSPRKKSDIKKRLM